MCAINPVRVEIINLNVRDIRIKMRNIDLEDPKTQKPRIFKQSREWPSAPKERVGLFSYRAVLPQSSSLASTFY
ncbi:hypothetical protein MMC28_011417 [Mycoblastus sanguinarius]|nr:hypothetical protein [Mycoblastus sanguinarius]